jgi:Spy/CpxP family protein refolding chaperone
MIRRRVVVLSILAVCALAFGCQSSKPGASDPPAVTSVDRELQQLSATASLTDQQRGKARTVLEIALRSCSMALRQPDPPRAAQLARIRTQVQHALFTIVTAEQKPQVEDYIAHSVLFAQS